MGRVRVIARDRLDHRADAQVDFKVAIGGIEATIRWNGDQFIRRVRLPGGNEGVLRNCWARAKQRAEAYRDQQRSPERRRTRQQMPIKG